MTEPAGRDIDAFRAARQRVLDRIDAAASRAGRDPSDVSLVAVSKTVTVERLRAAVAAGLTTLGENRVQEALAKVPALPGARWELVGPLQSNKARKALEAFARIESVDSLELARRLDRLVPDVRPGTRYPVLVQVNVDRDPAKAGFSPGDLERALDALGGLANLAIEGLMTIGRLAETPVEARATFRGLRELGERVALGWPGVGRQLSMGMTDDFELAVEEGATIVRVGRALFGERPHEHGDGQVADHEHR
jgi:pyridoxal phosphate enzyme (YggS family)